MIKILFVCLGNICRSPMAEYILKELIKEKHLENEYIIDSAATSREEIGNDIYPPAKACHRSHKVPFDRHHARQMTREDLSHYDRIIAMEEYNIRNPERMFGSSDKYSLLLDYTDFPGNISDPWYTGDFETVYNQIEKGCMGFLKMHEKNRFG